MRASLYSFSAFFYSVSVMGQSDLYFKKEEPHYSVFFPGSELIFSANFRYYDAYVTSIEKDSVLPGTI